MGNKTSKYWSIYQTLTYNSLFNVIVGNRTAGKSYGTIKYVIERFLKYKEQFGYVRRYKDDLKEPLEEIFKDMEKEFPDYEYRVVGRKIYFRLKPPEGEKVKWTEDDIIGYGFVLSTANNRKSIPYPRITTLVFDEFLIEKGNIQYVSDEPTKLMSLYETIARPGTDHPRVRVFLLANAISVTNPYFLYWDLRMPTKLDRNGKLMWRHPTRPIIVEDVQNEELIKEKEQSEFGAMVKGTKYGEHSINNKFLLDDNTFIEKKSNTARYYFTFVYKENTFGVWADFNKGKMWVSYDIDPSFLLTYSLTLKDHSPNTMLINSAGRRSHFKTFVQAFKDGCLYFENMNVKNLTYEVIKMVIN